MVTERQDGRAVWESEMFRLLAENVHDYAIFFLDPEGRIAGWTGGAERLLGYREEDIVGRPFAILFTPEEQQLAAPRVKLDQARSTGRGEDDRWHVRQDGSRFWASGVITPLWDEAGALRGYAKIMRDRTEWKRQDQARQAEEAGKAAVLQTALDGIITVDHEDRILEFNPAAERLFGYRRSDVLGQKMGELIVPPNLRSQHYEGMRRYLASEEGPGLRKRLKLSAMRSDGSEFPAELAIVRVPTDDAILFTGFVRDISERLTQERRTATQLKITQVLVVTPTIAEAAVPILQAVCEGLDWDFAAFWQVDGAASLLRCTHTWQRPEVRAEAFEKVSRERPMLTGVGLPGRVWRTGEPVWLPDVGQDDNLPRLALAAQAGLKGAFAIPLRFGDQVLGVMEFLSRSTREPNSDLLAMMAAVGGQIGQYIQRQHAEEALRESEERFRGLMEQSPFSMQVFSRDGRVLGVNRAWEELWGISADQIGDYNILEDSQLAAKGALDVIRRAFAGQAVEVPVVHYDPNETVPDRTRHEDPRRWVSAVAYPIRDVAGGVREVILVHEDVTARKQAEDALRESEERFRGIVHYSIAGVCEVDLQGRFLFANARYCEIVGRSEQELRNLRMQDISHSEDLPRNLSLFEGLSRDGTPYVIEKRYLRPDGTEIWVNNSVSGLRDHTGRVKSIVAVCVDVTDRRRAEQAYREGEERIRTLTDNMPDGAVYRSVQNSVDGTLRFTFLSAGVEQIFGVTAAEGVTDASLLYRAIHQDDQPRVLEEEARALQALQRFNTEFRVRRPDGELRWIHCRSAPNRLSGDEIIWEGVILDVTDRKEAEQALREQEDRLRLALEAGHMGTWNWDVRTGEVRWSPQLEAIHGLAEGTFPGTFEAYQEDMHPDDRERVLASIGRSLETGEEYHVEYRLVLPDGSIRWVEARGTAFCDEHGQPLQMIGVCTEATARKKSEHDLRFLADASHSLATLVDYESALQRIAGLAVPHFADWCSIYLADGSGKLRQLAVAHADPSKLRLAEEIRQRWPPSPSRPGGVYQVFQTGKSVLVEHMSEDVLREVVQDDEHLEVLRNLGLKSYMCVPLALREHTIGVISFIAAESGRRYTAADLAVAEDLAHRAAIASENARLYATLRQEGARKDEFLAMLAHELRNPLAPIRSGLDLLGMSRADREVLDMMQQQLEHLVRLVDDLLDVSRIMRGKVELRREPVELSAIVARVLATVRPLVDGHKQHLLTSVPPNPIWLDADPVRLAQVIGNLLNNASKYTESGGNIWLSAEAEEGQVGIRVRDSGIGIRSELLPHIFDLFTQDQQTIDRSQGGLGIGLTVARSLVEMHGGSVTASSDGPDQGSEFVVRLPTIAPPQIRVQSAQPSAAVPSLRILLVDDNISAAKMLGLLLTRIGEHQVYLAHDGLAALAAAKEHRPDLILLDIGLPKLDGFEVARRIRQEPELQDVYLVALTGYGTDEDRRKSLAAGFDEHLVKPPQIEALQHLLPHAKRAARRP